MDPKTKQSIEQAAELATRTGDASVVVDLACEIVVRLETENEALRARVAAAEHELASAAFGGLFAVKVFWT